MRPATEWPRERGECRDVVCLGIEVVACIHASELYIYSDIVRTHASIRAPSRPHEDTQHTRSSSATAHVPTRMYRLNQPGRVESSPPGRPPTVEG